MEMNLWNCGIAQNSLLFMLLVVLFSFLLLLSYRFSSFPFPLSSRISFELFFEGKILVDIGLFRASNF